MDCASFEDLLQRSVSGEIEESAREGALGDLVRHARACPECVGAGDLLDWLALPGADRDLADDPGEAYWASFNGRLQDRIAHEAGAPVKRDRHWIRWVGAAAAVGAASLVLWGVLAPTDDGSASRRAEAGIRDGLPEATLEFPASLVEIIEADPAALRDYGFGGAGGWPGPIDDEGWVFPDTEDLDPAAQDELLEWLRERIPEGAGVRS